MYKKVLDFKTLDQQLREKPDINDILSSPDHVYSSQAVDRKINELSKNIKLTADSITMEDGDNVQNVISILRDDIEDIYGRLGNSNTVSVDSCNSIIRRIVGSDM